MAAREKQKNVIENVKPLSSDYLNTVRLLHETIVCLRKALERSQSELSLLRTKVITNTGLLKYCDTIEQLTLENHVLRRKILLDQYPDSFSMDDNSDGDRDNTYLKTNKESENQVENGLQEKEDASASNFGDFKTENVFKNKSDSDESDEVDDIELIFITDDSKVEVQEKLEPVSDDDVFESGSNVNQQVVSTQSVLVEADISKCGIVGQYDNVSPHSSVSECDFLPHQKELKNERRVKKSPGIMTDEVAVTENIRPILNKTVTSVRDSEVQTDISALPLSWRSESFLIHNKRSQNFPTLPSKFAISVKEPDQKCRLNINDKTEEARRALLSDINFTSMVPELSRSVDHLCQNGVRLPSSGVQSSFAMKYLKSPVLLNSGSSYSRFDFSAINPNWNCYDNSCTSDNDRSMQDNFVRRRQSWQPSLVSLDAYYLNRTSSVPPSPTLRRHSAAVSCLSNADPQFYYVLPSKFNMKTFSSSTLKNVSMPSVFRKPKAKVSFKGEKRIFRTKKLESYFSKNTGSRQSLPNMHVDAESGEDSTESLIEESEECVKKSIETTFNSIDWPYLGHPHVGRTYSVPNLFLEFSPPLSARPFIARSPSELKANYFVKVINKEGRVVGGRIQYVGTVAGKSEPYVGILLPPNLGETDGTLQGLRYFVCERNCGLFVPFRKVVMAWKV